MATLFVDAGGGAAFTLIQAAIDAASAGDTIVVAAGIYIEDLIIDKAVTIQGAKVGVVGTDAGRDAAGGVGETTIVGLSTGLSTITASGAVTIDGVRFLKDDTTPDGGSTLLVQGDSCVITNSIFYSEVIGGAVGNIAIGVTAPTTGTVEVSDNYFTGAFPEAFSGASWARGIFFSQGDVEIAGNTFEFTRTGINLDMEGVSAATVTGNTFITNGTGTTVAFDFDNVSFADNNYEDTREDFSFSNLTTDVVFDAEAAVATVTPVNVVVDTVVVLGGTGDDTLRGTAGADLIDGNASGLSVADNDTLEGRDGNDVLYARLGDDKLYGGLGFDILLGGGGNDVLDGGGGNDQVIGGDGDDAYIYSPGSAADTFNGFVAGLLSPDDHVDISAFTTITTFAQVLALATQVGADTVIDFTGGDVLTLANVLMTSLVEDDFFLTAVGVNDPPAGTDKTVIVAEDGSYVFATADFGFSDATDTPPNALAAVKISSLPAAGSLLYNNVAITAGQVAGGYEVSAADIAAGLLRFTPAADANGAAYASFTFQVRDDGGTASGGVDTDQSPNTITIDVTAVDDPTPSGVTIIGTKKADLVDATHTVAGQPLPTAFNDVIEGKGKKDDLSGLAGDDTIKGGDGKDKLKGGDGADALKGNKGEDKLTGEGGIDRLDGSQGSDELTGGAANDTFVFAHPDQKDKITDFTEGDIIALEKSAFKGLGPLGTLEADRFRIGDKAKTEKQKILYDEDSGWLLYAKKGSDTADPVRFAKIGKNLDDFDNGDILVI